MAGLARVTQPVVEDVTHVLVREAVVHDPSGPAARHDTPLSQQPELVAQAGFADAEQRREITDAQLGCEAERVDDAGPRRVREDVERGCDALGEP